MIKDFTDSIMAENKRADITLRIFRCTAVPAYEGKWLLIIYADKDRLNNFVKPRCQRFYLFNHMKVLYPEPQL